MSAPVNHFTRARIQVSATLKGECLLQTTWRWPDPRGDVTIFVLAAIHSGLVMMSLSSFQLSCSVVSNSFATPWTAAHQDSVHHQLLELAQTHVHWVGDAIQPSHPLSGPSPPAFSLSQNDSVFQLVSPSHQVGKILVLQLQHQSFQWIFRTDFLYDWQLWSSCNPRESQESSPAPQFKSINSSVLSFLYSPSLTSIHDHWKNQSFD